MTEPGIADPFNRNALITTTYRWNDLDGDLDFDEGEQGAFVTATGASSSVLNPDLEQPKTHEVTATLERQIGLGFSARTSYVYKRESGLFQSVNVARPFDAFNIPLTAIDPGPDGTLGTSDDGGAVTYYDYCGGVSGRGVRAEHGVEHAGIPERRITTSKWRRRSACRIAGSW